MLGWKNIWIVAKNTFREIFRDRILYGIMVSAVILLGISIALGGLTYTEQARISINFGYTAIELSAVILSIFVGSTLVRREIEKKTILTLLARPVSRYQFVIGKSLGLFGIIFISAIFLTLCMGGILFAMDLSPKPTFFVGVYGVLLESMVLLSITLFFGTFSSAMLSVSFTIGIFLIGHWLDSLKYFSERSGSPLFLYFAKGIKSIVPNLEWFNWRSLFIYDLPIPHNEIVVSSVYSIAWAMLMVTLSAFILGQKDLG